MENFSAALTSLESLNKTFEVFVPSLNKKVAFKGLTTKQQKEAVKTALDKNVTGLTFSILINKIISENSVEKNPYILTDRSYIITSLRIQSLSPIIQREEGPLDLSYILNNNFPIPAELKQRELVDDNVKINVSIPSLEKDSFVNNETKKKLAPLPDDDEFAKESVGEIYVNELIKYIDKITVSGANAPTILTLNELTFEQKVQVVEKLPLKLNTKLVEYINELKVFEKKYFTKDSEDIDFEIDPTLFTV